MGKTQRKNPVSLEKAYQGMLKNNSAILQNEGQHILQIGAFNIYKLFLTPAVTNPLFQTIIADMFLSCLITLGLSQRLSRREGILH